MINLYFPRAFDRVPVTDITKFPGGEMHVRIAGDKYNHSRNDPIVIEASLTSSEDLMVLLLTHDAVKRVFDTNDVSLVLPYVPYARQDRVAVKGDPLSIAVFARMINSCGFSRVIILDPHSDVTSALIDNVRVVEPFSVFAPAVYDHVLGEFWVVAPDAGASKKAHQFAVASGAVGVVQCLKTRDPVTGRLGDFMCTGNVEGKNLLIVDDICDGGGTFVGLSKILREAGAASIELMVTHGIFSKGVDVVAEHFDRIYTTNSFTGSAVKHDKVVCVNVFA